MGSACSSSRPRAESPGLACHGESEAGSAARRGLGIGEVLGRLVPLPVARVKWMTMRRVGGERRGIDAGGGGCQGGWGHGDGR